MTSEFDRLILAASLLRGWSSQAALSRGLTQAGYPVTQAMLSNWRTRGVSKDAKLRASQIIGCSIPWLESGDGEMAQQFTSRIPSREIVSHNSVVSSTIPIRQIPLINWVKAGEVCGVVDLFEPGDAEQWVPYAASCGPHTYALRVQGDSMTSQSMYERSYPAGCVIIVDPEKPVLNGSRVIAKSSDEEATFKIFREVDGKKTLHPLNPAYPVIEMTDDMMICGVIVGGFWQE